MERKKTHLIRYIDKHPVAGGATLKTLLKIGTDQVKTLKDDPPIIERDGTREKSRIANQLELTMELVKHEPEFIIDLLAMHAGYVTAETLKEKYKDA